MDSLSRRGVLHVNILYRRFVRVDFGSYCYDTVCPIAMDWMSGMVLEVCRNAFNFHVLDCRSVVSKMFCGFNVIFVLAELWSKTNLFRLIIFFRLRVFLRVFVM